MTDINYTDLLQCVEQIALKAGSAIMDIYERDFLVETKKDSSPLTEADKAANAIIVNELVNLPDSIPILTEEAVEDFSGPDEKDRYWLVDPLDGTKEFIKRNGEFTVNIALIEKGRPTLGVVYAPALNVRYLAAEGLGAFKVEGSSARKKINVAIYNNDRPWNVVGSRSHASEDTLGWLSRLQDYELIPMGSSLKICLVAEGRADLYPRLGPTCLWDTAAAHAVVNCSGGMIKTLDGIDISYSDTNNKLNPYFIVCSKDQSDL